MNNKHTVGTVINSTLIQRNGGSYKLVDARDIDFAGASVLGSTVDTYAQLVDAINSLNNTPSEPSDQSEDVDYIIPIDEDHKVLVTDGCYKYVTYEGEQDDGVTTHIYTLPESEEEIEYDGNAYNYCECEQIAITDGNTAKQLDVIHCPSHITFNGQGDTIVLPFCYACKDSRSDYTCILKT